MLRSRQGAALAHGVLPGPAFLDGYHAGLAVTIVLVAAGVVISYVALRRLPAPVPGLVPVAADGLAAGAAAGPAGSGLGSRLGSGPADGQAPGSAAGPELAGRRS